MYGINENFYRIICLTSSRQADHKINLLERQMRSHGYQTN